MAGGGKVYSLVLLMALLALSTTSYAARSYPIQQSLNREIMRAFGVSRAEEPCCLCACTVKWPPEVNICVCGSEWKGTCPSACKNCVCDDSTNKCRCDEIFKYNECPNPCPLAGAAGGAHIGM